MIAKIHTGNNFGGLVNYANDIVKKDAVVVASYGVSLTSNAAITANFKAQAKARPGVKNFVGHISLSFSPNDKDKVNNDLMAQIAREYMRRMGIVNTQFVVFRHQDQPHPHVHIVYNRVNNEGDAIMGDCNFRKSAAITKALTREYGLTFGKGKKNVRRERLKGKDVIKYRIYDEVNASLTGCSSWQDLCKVLSPKGISLDFVRDSDESGCGVTFTDDGSNVTVAGGKIDHSLSYDSINQLLEDANVIGAAVTDMLLQPHVVLSSGGGGGSSSKDDDDEDKDRDKKNNYIPRKRKR